MIQELLGGGVVGVGSGGGGPEERKISIINTGSSSSSSTSSSSTSSSSSEQQQNLRCPRCDSSNTKFCYYNNYNLTQPRHFCKTCRRYWTKGGALRNVPIGGGCRKNKTSTVSASTAATKSAGKPNKPAPAGTTPDVGTKPGFGPAGFDELPSSPVLWPTPHNSQLLALLRAASQQNPNPNPILNSVAIKEEVVGLNMGVHMGHNSDHSHSSLAAAAMNASISPQLPSFGLCSSFWRSQQQQQQQQQQSQVHLQQHHHTSTLQHGMVVGEAHPSGTSNGGIQELYQRLRSSANYYNDHNSPSTFSNAGSSSACSIVESTGGAPIAAGDQLGYWSSPFSWSDLSTTNGAFP